jgi:hypothetical protein
MIVPYFGPFPEWMDIWLADFMRTMRPQGYSLLLDTDLPAFKDRVKDKLGIDFPGVRGGAKAWDYRGSLGALYEEEIKGFDFWGHCDFDVVWGQINKWASDQILSELDVYSSHDEYVCGCFSLYRNIQLVNNLFKDSQYWIYNLSNQEPTGWIEKEYSRTLELSGLRYKYDLSPQGNPFTDEPILKKEGDNLYQFIDGFWQELGFFHFRRSKKYPFRR